MTQAETEGSKIIELSSLENMITSNDPILRDNSVQILISSVQDSIQTIADLAGQFDEKTSRKVTIVATGQRTNSSQGVSSVTSVPLTSGGLMSLLALALLLLIFICGFMCLWNIEPPQQFEIGDRDGSKRKSQ